MQSLRSSLRKVNTLNTNTVNYQSIRCINYVAPEDVKRIPFLGRTGVVALKCGMVPAWDHWGTRFALTVLKVEDCQVIQQKTKENDGYFALQVGAGMRKLKHTKKPQLRHFEKAGVEPKRYVTEFRVKEEGLLEPGTEISAMHFIPGQFVDIQGVSIGKGFQGGMKKWGFKGQPASHGVSLTHRSLGSTGQCQDPGRVWKGKKMAGRMGGNKVSIQCQEVYRIDPEKNLIYIKGHVPGKRGQFVKIKDSVKKMIPTELVKKMPFPTYIPGEEAPNPEDLIVPAKKVDPYKDAPF